MRRGRIGRGLGRTGVVALVAGALILSGCTASGTDHDPDADGTALTDARVRPLVADVPHRSVAGPPAMRLAPGLVPPTNRWYSGLVFGAEPTPVFPFPLSFELMGSGFAAGLPTVVSSADTIATSPSGTLSVDLGATSTRVSAYDDVAVTVEHRSGGAVVGRTTIAEGSPLVSYVAARVGTITLGAPVDASRGRGTVRVDGRTWAVVTARASIDGADITVRKGSTLTLMPVPDGASRSDLAHLLDAAESPLASVATAPAAVGSGERTTLAYRTASGGHSVVVPLPHQGSAAGGCTGLSYATIYGTVPVCIASQLRFTTPAVAARAGLDLSSLTEADRTELRRSLRTDVRDLPGYAADTYYGGKSLYRGAMLLQLARDLGDDASEATLTASLVRELDTWTEPDGCRTRSEKCFVFDPVLKTMVGRVASFGSELVNDHHFHYGYFLYAAGVAAADDPERAKRWSPVLDLLAADIASDSGSGSGAVFPDHRAYDPYFSHSWASGFSEFASGNNQESSSEAVTAWAGLRLWARATGDDALEAEASWLQSNETASALAYWVAPDLSDAQFEGYDHALVSLTWSGKRDFGTWFSADPSAVIGIQLIPMSPSSGYLASSAGGDAQHIRTLARQALAAGSGAPLADYALMYRAMAGEAAASDALTDARRIPRTELDDGDSRTYLLAFIMSELRSSS